jgi:hypothetical protein
MIQGFCSLSALSLAEIAFHAFFSFTFSKWPNPTHPSKLSSSAKGI